VRVVAASGPAGPIAIFGSNASDRREFDYHSLRIPPARRIVR